MNIFGNWLRKERKSCDPGCSLIFLNVLILGMGSIMGESWPPAWSIVYAYDWNKVRLMFYANNSAYPVKKIVNAGSPSATLAQQWTNVGCVCWDEGPSGLVPGRMWGSRADVGLGHSCADVISRSKVSAPPLPPPPPGIQVSPSFLLSCAPPPTFPSHPHLHTLPPQPIIQLNNNHPREIYTFFFVSCLISLKNMSLII